MLGRRSLSLHGRPGAVCLRQPLRSGATRRQDLRAGPGQHPFLFPWVGVGAVASGSKLVTDEMFMAAAHTLAYLVTPEDIEQGSLYPSLPRIREVSAHIADAVAEA